MFYKNSIGAEQVHSALAIMSVITVVLGIISTALPQWLIVKFTPTNTLLEATSSANPVSYQLGTFVLCSENVCETLRYSSLSTSCSTLVTRLEACAAMSILGLVCEIMFCVPTCLLGVQSVVVFKYLRPWVLPVFGCLSWLWLLTSWGIVSGLYYNPPCGSNTFGSGTVYYGISFQLRVIEFVNVCFMLV
eukprot:PhF_6_TR40068/c0_g1_i1/m.59434